MAYIDFHNGEGGGYSLEKLVRGGLWGLVRLAVRSNTFSRARLKVIVNSILYGITLYKYLSIETYNHFFTIISPATHYSIPYIIFFHVTFLATALTIETVILRPLISFNVAAVCYSIETSQAIIYTTVRKKSYSERFCSK